MAFKSDKQKLWLEKNKPEVAKQVSASVQVKVNKPKKTKGPVLPKGGFHQ